MPIIRCSKKIWKLVMTESIETDVSASVILDRLLAEAIEDGRHNSRTTQNSDKKGSPRRSKKYIAGVKGLIGYS